MDWYGWVVLGLFVFSVLWYIYVSIIKQWFDYRKAKKEIFVFVMSYKRRCTGNNRFIVTVESLQDSFRGYNTSVITNVWLDLVNERVIQQDSEDNEWCVK